jgi:hypothetical protein
MFPVLRPSYSGQRKRDFTLRFRLQEVYTFPMAYDEKSCLVEKTGELSNLKFIQNLARFFRLK